MQEILKLVTLTAFVAFGSTAMAQDTNTPATDTPAEGSTATEAPAEGGDAPAEGQDQQQKTPDLDMGQEVVDPNAPGTPYVKEKIGDWEMRCVKVEEGQKEPCKLFQLLQDDKGNSIAEFNLVVLPKGGQAVAGVTAIVPLETLLTKQLTISVDGGAKKRYAFRFCGQAGCYAQIGLSNADVATYKRGAKGTLSIVPAFAPDKTISVDISLSGFTKAYEALKAYEEQ